MIKSCPFSFVRFEHPQQSDVSLDIPYSLPVYDKHNIAFHFIVSNDRPLDQPIKLGIADTSGNFVSAFAPAPYAVAVNYRYHLAGLLTTAVFQLYDIFIGASHKTYGGRTVTPGSFVQIMEDDFGIIMIEDYFLTEQILFVKVNALKNGTYPVFSPNEFNAMWNEGYVGLTNAPVIQTDCFTYCLLNEDNSVIGYSNKFKPFNDAAYTSLFTYGCEDNAFDFTYAEGINFFGQRKNMIRLPVYLLKPDWPAKRVVNRQSDGKTQLLSALMEKQYAIETEQMPEVFHECLRAALLHDSVVIECINIREPRVEVLEADNYMVAWNDEYKLSYAPGKGTVKVSSFGYTNSNC